MADIVGNVCISGDSKKTFRTLRVNISKTIQFKTIKFCICLEYDVIMMWYKFHNHTPNIQRMAGHTNCKSNSAISLIHRGRQSVATGDICQSVRCQHVKMSRCQSVTFQYDTRDAISFK
jgi:hypothetical protein